MPYGDYFTSGDTLFPVWQRSDLLPDKAQIFAIRVGSVPAAYPVDVLVEKQLINDTIAEVALVVLAQSDPVEVRAESELVGQVTYLAGAEVRAYERGAAAFSLGLEAETLLDESGGVWQVRETQLVGPAGQTLPRLPGHLAYWFGWYAFFPNTLLYGVNESC